MTEKDAVASNLRDSPPHHGHPQSRYPSSRWQQLKHSIAARDGVHADTLVSYRGLAAVGAYEVKTSCLEQDLLEPDASSSIQQEAADVLRRVTDTNDPSPMHSDKSSSLAIQPDGTIISNSRYQGLLDSSIAEFSSFGLLLPLASTGQPPAREGVHTRGVSTDPARQLSEGRSPSKHAALQQLKHQRQQTRPQQVSAGPATSTAVNPMKQHPRASTARPVSAPHAPLRLRASHQLVRKQPAAAHSARNLSTSFSGSWADLGSRSVIGLQIGPQATAPGINDSPLDLITRGRAVTAGVRTSITAVTADPAGRASTATAAAQECPILCDSDSYALDSIKGLDNSLMHELQQELADQMLNRIVRRWRQATADVHLDKVRARPMLKLLSKRKALRAWKLAHQQHLGDQLSDAAHQEISQDIFSPANQAVNQYTQDHHSQQQSSVDAATAAQVSDMQQHNQQQLDDRAQRRDTIAAQFHKLYRVHGCLSSWRQQAAAAALQRLREENDRVLAEEQARVLQQQQEREQQQQQQHRQQLEQHRLAVAANFHKIYIQHKVLTGWHQQAFITASLNKLFPDTGLAAAVAAAPGAGRAARCGHTFPAGLASDELQAAAVVQQKAQQLLHRLASKQSSQQQQQQQQPGMRTSDSHRAQQSMQQPLELRQQEQRQHLPQQEVAELQQQELSAAPPEPVAAACTGLHGGVTPPERSSEVKQQQQQQRDGLIESAVVPATQQQICEDDQVDIQPGYSFSGEEAISNVAAADAAVPGQPDTDSPGTDAPADPTDGLPQQQLGPAAEDAETQQQQQQPQLAASALQDMQPVDSATEPLGLPAQQQPQQKVAAEQTAALPPQQEQLQQVPQQQSWEEECQHLRRLHLAEQRRQRQQQVLEQELQAEIAAEQAALAELHYNLVLVQRLGLQPWRALGHLRQQQAAVAASCRSMGLLKAGLMVWKLLLVQRRKKHVCCHIRAYGLLVHLHQQLQQASALAALAAWSYASKHYRHCLQQRTIAAWRDELQSSQQLQAAAKLLREDRRKCRVIHAWAQYVEQQAQEQLLWELELDAAAQKWRYKWLQCKVLTAWHAAASTAICERELEARRQETWCKVRSWLSERDSSMARSTTPLANGQCILHMARQDTGHNTPPEVSLQPHQRILGDSLGSLCRRDAEAVDCAASGLSWRSAIEAKQAAAAVGCRRYASQHWGRDLDNESSEAIDDECVDYSL